MRKRIEQTHYAPSPTLRLLTVLQVADILGVGKDTVYSLIKHEGLPAVSIGLVGTRQKLRIAETSLECWIKEREQAFASGMDTQTNGQTDVEKPKQQRKARSTLVVSEGEIIPLPSKQASAQSS